MRGRLVSVCLALTLSCGVVQAKTGNEVVSHCLDLYRAAAETTAEPQRADLATKINLLEKAEQGLGSSLAKEIPLTLPEVLPSTLADCDRLFLPPS